MVVWEDTRQQQGKHDIKHQWFAAHGIEVVRRKLDFGDYMRDGSNVSIDTKKDVQELAGDVGRDHKRFVRELDRAAEAGYQLVVLVEGVTPYQRERVMGGEWVSGVCMRCKARRGGLCRPLVTKGCEEHGRKPLMGHALSSMLASLEKGHAVRFMFCRREDSARVICELLGVRYQG